MSPVRTEIGDQNESRYWANMGVLGHRISFFFLLCVWSKDIKPFSEVSDMNPRVVCRENPITEMRRSEVELSKVGNAGSLTRLYTRCLQRMDFF